MPYYLTKINAAENQRRFYSLEIMPTLFGEWSVVREWGRIGSSGQLKVDVFPTEEAAQSALTALVQKKIKRGYCR